MRGSAESVSSEWRGCLPIRFDAPSPHPASLSLTSPTHPSHPTPPHSNPTSPNPINPPTHPTPQMEANDYLSVLATNGLDLMVLNL
jgi:hypothetical protein